MARRHGVEAALLGCLLFAAACALPGIGLFRGHLGTSVFQNYGDRVLSGGVPYRDFSLEYPPGALPAFVLPSFGPARDYDTWFMGFQAACGLACVALVGLWTRSRAAAAYCALAPLALGPLTLHRYDLWAAVLATAGTVALVAGRGRLGIAALGAGAAAKIFPVALLPLALIHVGRRHAVRALAWFTATLLVVVGPFLVLGAGGVRFSIDRQLGRALQIETLGSSALLFLHEAGSHAPRVVFGRGSWNLSGGLPSALAALSTVLQLAALVAVWALYARGPRTPERFLTASAAAVAAWIVFGKVLSPQFLVWLVPLVALLRARGFALLLLAALGLTQAIYPGRYDELVSLQSLPVALLAARNALLLALALFLALDLQRQHVPEQVGADGESPKTREPAVLDGRERDGPDRVPGLEPGGRE
jgi:hypothetical protein